MPKRFCSCEHHQDPKGPDCRHLAAQIVEDLIFRYLHAGRFEKNFKRGLESIQAEMAARRGKFYPPTAQLYDPLAPCCITHAEAGLPFIRGCGAAVSKPNLNKLAAQRVEWFEKCAQAQRDFIKRKRR